MIILSFIDTNKVSLGDQQLLINGEKANLNGGYLQIVGSDTLYVDKQSLPKLIEAPFNENDMYERNSKADLKLIKDDDSHDASSMHRDSDGENKCVDKTKNHCTLQILFSRCDNRTLKKSLPHKKRISRKLKKSVTTTRKLTKCNLCDQTFSTPEEFTQHQSLCQTTITPVNSSAFSCQLCNATFGDQLTFFGHLKSHYEPVNEENTDDATVIKKK